MASGKKGDNSLSFPFGIRTSSCFSRVKIWIHEFNYNTLHTIYNYNTYINHFITNEEEKKIMSNAYMVKRSWLFSLGFFFFFLVVLERKGCPNNNLHESFGVWHFGRYRDLLWLLRLNLLIQFSARGQKGQKKKVFRIL